MLLNRHPLALAIGTLFIGSITLLTACNDSGSSSVAASPSTGVFLDAEVKGLAYSSSACTSNCFTNEKGEFLYNEGDVVTFKVGSTVIGSAQGAVRVYTNTLTGEADILGEKSVRLARLLQTMNIKTSAEDGIDLTNVKLATGCNLDSDAGLQACVGSKALISHGDAAAHLASTVASKAFVKSVSFSETPAPSSADQMATTYTTSVATLTYADGTTKDFPLSYHKLFGVKDKVGSSQYAAGQLFDANMNPLKDSLGQPVIAETPDANSLLNIGGKLYLVSHLEYDWIISDGSSTKTRQPMGMTLTQVSQDAKTGKLTATGQEPINFSSVGGLWIPCFGSQTPWNTHLGSEEDYDLQYNPLGSSYATTLKGVDVMKNVYGNANASPYQYGYLTEVVVGKDGKATPIKHYGLGRGTWEMGKVMPDGKTVYFGDDGSNVAIFMFVGNVSGDLSKGGSLYAAKWTQISAANGGAGELTWVKLGESKSNDEIKALADANTFDSIFNNHTYDTATKTCTAGTRIRAGSTADECLSIKPGMETAAAFLESRRTAALLGATAEFNKMEGIAVNAKDKHIYMAISYLDGGMLKNDAAPTDHVQLPKISAGATFTLAAKSGQEDTEGNAIASDYVATSMYVEAGLLGEDITRDAMGNTANPNKIANTDNIFFSERMRTLFVGEDSGTHVNNFVWAYNVDTKKLTRILSAVTGAENTGLQVVDNMNGYAYIMSNSQHHGDWKPSATDSAVVAESLTKIDKFDANIGYIGGLPAMK